MEQDSIVDVPGLRVGHYSDLQAATGCTVVLCDQPMVGGCFVSGAAPGTRETALLDPNCLVQEVDAVLLGGGSAFGLDAATGVMRYLEERGRGFDTRVARVPIVPAAILYDLGIGSPKVRPGAEEGYRACLDARAGRVDQGNVGAGTGATVGKLLGPHYAMKGGLGSASMTLPGGAVVGAIAAVNCAGDVVDPSNGMIVAGARDPRGGGLLGSEQWLRTGGFPDGWPSANTVIAVVATNAHLGKAHCSRLALLAYQGLARAVRPITMFDGDVVFSLAASQMEAKAVDLSLLGAAAAEALVQAILRGVRSADSLGGYPSSLITRANGT